MYVRRGKERGDKLKPRCWVFFYGITAEIPCDGIHAPPCRKNETRMCIVASRDGRGINLRDC